MTERYEFCTLFDAYFLARAVVLARSLAQVCGPDGFRLRAFCMDRESEELMRALELPGVTVISIDALETHDRGLAAVRSERSRIEYCWTATSAACLYCLETERELEMITYVDADHMMFSDPAPIFDEIGDASIALTPHKFAPDLMHHQEVAGPYNVGLVAFRNDNYGLEALRYWRERCLEWCFDRLEPDRFGDQRYLDDFPERFQGVHVIDNPGGIAPWNARRYRLESTSDGPTVDGLPVIYHHYASLKLYDGEFASPDPLDDFERLELHEGDVSLLWDVECGWPVSARERELLWRPYLARVADAYGELRGLRPNFAAGITPAIHEMVVLLDGNYLPRALAMWRSLELASPSVRLHIYCMDETAARILRKLKLKRTELIDVSELEDYDPELKAVKPSRSSKEYCQTAKPAALLHTFARHPEIDLLTLVDADLYFYQDPRDLFDDLGEDGCILLTPHRIIPRLQFIVDEGGIYNTGFVAFRRRRVGTAGRPSTRDERAMDALRWWREKCLDWCYEIIEPERYTDQKYVQHWPETREGVRVMRHVGGGLAPWNMHGHDVRDVGGEIEVDGLPLVFFHYQSLRIYRGLASLRRYGFGESVFELTRGLHPMVWNIWPVWEMTKADRVMIWHQYLLKLAWALKHIKAVEPGFDARQPAPRANLRVIGKDVLELGSNLGRGPARALVPRPLRKPLRRGFATLQLLAATGRHAASAISNRS